MKETELQDFFYRYQESQNKKQQEDYVQELSVVVYNYSQESFPNDKDIGSDFFVELYPQISKLINEYNPKRGVSFKNYLSFRLMLLTRSFVQKTSRQKNFVQFQSIEEIVFDDQVRSLFNENQPNQSHNQKYLAALKTQTQDHLNQLPPEVQLMLKLHFCLSLSLSDFRYLRQEKKLAHFMLNIRKFQAKALERKENLEFKRMTYKRKLLRYSLLVQYHPTHADHYSKRYHNLIKNEPSILEGLRYREISKLMSIPVSSIHRKIKMAQELLSQVLPKGSTS